LTLVRRWQRIGLLGGIAGFVLVALDVRFDGALAHADASVNAWMDGAAANGWPVRTFGDALSQPGWLPVSTVLVAGAVAWMLRCREMRLAGSTAAGGLATLALTNILKAAFRRPLPPAAATAHPESFAFPSGHTLAATAALGLAIFLSVEAWQRRVRPSQAAGRRAWTISIVAWGLLSLAVGVARVLAGAHWMSDVLASWVLGTAMVCAGLLAVRVPHARLGS
jgi:membrane-associated phospholipid phosphatase